MPQLTIPKIQKMKAEGEKIAVVTCYDASFARLIDEAVDVVLVGDSLGMVIQGHESTLPVTLNDMIYHSAAVARGLTHPLLVADMPFMSYQAEFGAALKAAGQLLKKGKAQSVKVEGGEEVTELVYRMSRVGIPVMGHIGLEPQKIHRYGGFKIQGKGAQEEKHLLTQAKALQEAGAWSIVLEGIPMEAAEKITSVLKIPTIGIASGPHCDGQVLVLYDLLGMNPDFNPRFLKKYAQLSKTVTDAVKDYANDVKSGSFPDKQHSFARGDVYSSPGAKRKKSP
ncbi:MAG TPA: 3-methyl-2-oxobutanoate hydroxymethyltransferase [bacterium]|nr:3-methyl-2-oxobutanoate hydroxymethyltransferase [bacterium]